MNLHTSSLLDHIIFLAAHWPAGKCESCHLGPGAARGLVPRCESSHLESDCGALIGCRLGANIIMLDVYWPALEGVNLRTSPIG